MGVARGILRDCHEAGYAAAALVFRAHGMAGALGRDHQHVEIRARLDQVEMHVEAMREEKGRALLHVGVQVIVVDVGLELVRREHHHHVGPFGRLGNTHDLEARTFRLLRGGRTFTQGDDDFADAGILQIELHGHGPGCHSR